MSKHLHIICLDVPYPVDYGGVFDLYYKLEALHAAGVQVYLHCFEYGRGRPEALNHLCKEVHYYCRHSGHKCISNRLPYIVASRASEALLERLLQDDYPILAEGVHCSYLLNDERFDNRKVLLRLHNVEYLYYKQLYDTDSSLKKLYYLHESKLLRKYEASIAPKTTILAVSPQDAAIYREELGAPRVEHLPVFLPFEKVKGREGTGCFCLYHGNLSVAENEAAAKWLITEIFEGLPFPLVIAGKNPSRKLEKLVSSHSHACLVVNPSEEEMQDMIAKAQIHLLPSLNCTGIKLKLLNALFNGRHCLVNEAMIEGTGLENGCHVARDAEGFQALISSLYEQPFTAHDITARQAVLDKYYNREANTQQLIKWIW